MGFLTGLDGYGIEFDTYDGHDLTPGPDSENHVGVSRADPGTDRDGGEALMINSDIPELENGTWFHAEVHFVSGHAQMWMSNATMGYPRTQVIDYTIPDWTNYDAYFGFTAATGGLSNVHAIDNFALTFGELQTEARTGPDQFVRVGDTVVLDGRTSINTDTLLWEQVAGALSVMIENHDQALASFTAPSVEEPSVLSFRLTVTGGTGTDSAITHITVLPPGPTPIVSESFNEPLDENSWFLFGTAAHDPVNGWIQLTPDSSNQAGAIFYRFPLSTAEFAAELDFYVGDNDGGDGLSFAFVTAPGVGRIGGWLGFFEGLDGYAVEFDTFDNSGVHDHRPGPDSENHVGISRAEGAAPGEELWINSDVPEMENGTWFHGEIVFVSGHVQLWLSNDSMGYPRTQLIDYTIANWTDYNAYFGFTAGTGAGTNVHAIDNFILTLGEPQTKARTGPDQSAYGGDVVTLDGRASTNAQTFLWEQVRGTSVVTLENHDQPVAAFTAPPVEETVVLTFRLTVTGGTGTDSATTHVTVLPRGLLPVASEDFNKALGEDEWLFFGSASHNLMNGWIQLTPDSGNQAGAVFYNKTFNSALFQAEFDAYCGSHDGADGLVFAFVKDPGIGDSGGAMGFFGGPEGYGIEFDTYNGHGQIPGPDSENHVGVSRGDLGAPGEALMIRDLPRDLENGTWFHAEVHFVSGHVQMWMSNAAIGWTRERVLDYIIEGWEDYDAYFGFTASTGGATNLQAVDNFVLDTKITEPIVPLELDAPTTRSISSGDMHAYEISTSTGQNLLITVETDVLDATIRLYASYAFEPGRLTYDYQNEESQKGKLFLVIPATRQGDYYILVYAASAPDTSVSYTIEAQYVGLYLGSVSPSQAGNAGRVTLSISGAGLDKVTEVSLIGPTGHPIPAAEIFPMSSTQLSATFDLATVDPGLHDLEAKDSEGHSALLEDIFEVRGTSVGGRLEARLVTHTLARSGRCSVLWLEYANVGDGNLPAPLFIVSSDPTVPMTLEQGGPYENLSVQILGINFDGPAGTLPPGASYRIPIYFQAATNEAQITFNLEIMRADSTPIDWNAVEAEVRPDDINPDLWAATWENFKSQIGSTWADYLRAMDSHATFLAHPSGMLRPYDPSRDRRWHYIVRKLFQAAIARARGVYLRRALASNTDAYSPAPGLPLEFRRVAYDTLDQRFVAGPLGRCWSHDFEYTLTRPDETTAVVKSPRGTARVFTKKLDGLWQAAPGNFSVLEQMPDGSYRLRERNGDAWLFTAAGRPLGIEDPNGNRITIEYTGEKLTGLSHSNGQSFGLEYNDKGRISRLTDHAGQVTEYFYDAGGEHLLKVVGPGDVMATYSYVPGSGSPADRALESVTYADGTHRRFAYDSSGRLAAEWRDDNAERIEFGYDDLGTVYVKDAANAVTRLDVGPQAQSFEVRDPLGNAVHLEYDEDFNLTRLVKPDAGAYKLAYDNRGNATEIDDPLGNTIAMSYTADLNRLDWLRDARADLTDFSYDAAGNLTGVTYPDGSAERIGYDHLGNVTSVRNRRGDTILLSYNSLSQLIRKDYPDGRWVTYEYDASGDVTEITDASGTIAIDYDTRGFMTRIEYPSGHWFTFTYNDAGCRTQRVGDDGYTLNYHYDTAGRLSRLTDGTGAEIIRYEYDATGRLVTEWKGNGTHTTYQYDAAGQVVHIVNHGPDVSVQSRFDYTYDANGNRTSMTTLEGTTTYDYDAIGQLAGVTYPSSRRVTYEYDAAGNRVRVTDNGVPTSYTTNNMNQYTQVGDATFAYDADGNMKSTTNTTGTTTYEYDVENRLVRVISPTSGTWEYTYDALGNRLAVEHDGVITHYVHDPTGLVDVAAEYGGEGELTARYVHGLGLVARIGTFGGAAYYSFDAIGHTRELTDSTGTLANTYDYDPFGIPLEKNETTPNPFQFVGRSGVMEEGNGLSFMRARFYRCEIGRFVSEDPTELLGGDVNYYCYVSNDPALASDPEGTGVALVTVPSGPECAAELHAAGIHGYTTYGGYRYDFMAKGGFRGWRHGQTMGVHTRTKLEPGAKPEPLGLEPYRARGFGGGRNCWQVALQWRAYFCGWSSQPPVDPIPPTFPTRPGGSGSVPVGGALDPNEKVGPTGRGVQDLVAVTDELQYIIHFENQPTATLSAQEVSVQDHLDPAFDLTTFWTTEVAFGNHSIALPNNSGEFSIRQTIGDNRPEVDRSWWLDITCELDCSSRIVKWTFRTLDPETGELPEDVYAGFLPPNDPNTGCGEGHVAFTVRLKPDTSPGTVIRNSATVVFDVEPAAVTNEVSNTVIDTSLPFKIEETVRTSDGRFRLRWNSWPGKSYTIWSRSDLTSGDWSETATVPSGGLSTLWTDSDTTSPRKFYRIGTE